MRSSVCPRKFHQPFWYLVRGTRILWIQEYFEEKIYIVLIALAA
jgi:hypothetical protein